MRTETITLPIYEPGDVVQLLTGGPPMTVLGECDDCGEISVGWFDKTAEFGWQFQSIQVPPEAIREVATN